MEISSNANSLDANDSRTLVDSLLQVREAAVRELRCDDTSISSTDSTGESLLSASAVAKLDKDIAALKLLNQSAVQPPPQQDLDQLSALQDEIILYSGLLTYLEKLGELMRSTDLHAIVNLIPHLPKDSHLYKLGCRIADQMYANMSAALVGFASAAFNYLETRSLDSTLEQLDWPNGPVKTPEPTQLDALKNAISGLAELPKAPSASQSLFAHISRFFAAKAHPTHNDK